MKFQKYIPFLRFNTVYTIYSSGVQCYKNLQGKICTIDYATGNAKIDILITFSPGCAEANFLWRGTTK